MAFWDKFSRKNSKQEVDKPAESRELAIKIAQASIQATIEGCTLPTSGQMSQQERTEWIKQRAAMLAKEKVRSGRR